MSDPLFLYGTLRDRELFEIVAGCSLRAHAAWMPGARVHWVADTDFPILVEGVEDTAEGLLVTVDAEARARLDFYECGFDYDLVTRRVETAAGSVNALVYLPPPERWPPGDPWSLDDWQPRYGALARTAADEYMRLAATMTTQEAAQAFARVRMRAAARLRARSAPSPSVLPPDMTAREVQPERTAQPYTDHFAVREDWLAFPLFDGGRSAVVKRASFLSGDAATVLPYDPVRDTVLVVRQFRHGPFVRGDLNPWTLEPAAGHIDLGETPEETARRELLEETGVTAGALFPVGRYYPSPGAYSEFLYSFVAIADLGPVDGQIGGVEDEAEDIMAHVLPFSQAMAMIDSGAANTGPLIVSLAWLALNRDRLRAGEDPVAD